MSEVLVDRHTTATLRPVLEERAAVQTGSDPATEDIVLMAAIGERDRVAFAQLFGRYERICWVRACRIVRNGGFADDVVQAVFIDIWRHAQRYDPSRAAVSSWIARMTHHKAVDAVRREAMHQRRRAGDDTLLASAVCEEPSPETVAQRTVESQRVRAAFRELSDPQQKVLFLAYFEQCTYVEIARLLGEPLGTVKSRGRLGLVALRGLLQTPADSVAR